MADATPVPDFPEREELMRQLSACRSREERLELIYRILVQPVEPGGESAEAILRDIRDLLAARGDVDLSRRATRILAGLGEAKAHVEFPLSPEARDWLKRQLEGLGG